MQLVWPLHRVDTDPPIVVLHMIFFLFEFSAYNASIPLLEYKRIWPQLWWMPLGEPSLICVSVMPYDARIGHDPDT